MSIQYIRSGDGTICIFVDGESITLTTDRIGYMKILDGLKAKTINTKQEISNLCDTQKAVDTIVSESCEGKVKVDLAAGKVWYDGVEFPDKPLCDRILRLMQEGQPFQYMLNFLERLGRNPNFRSVMQLFDFITHKGFPITPEGKLLAYKGINANYTDKWTGKIDNSIGAEVSMDRKNVCQDFHQACAPGLHAGTFKYASDYAGGNGIVVLVEVDPSDVVSVPSSETEKMRCCAYRVIKDHKDGVLTGEVYDSTGKAVSATQFGQFDNPTASHWQEDEGRSYDPLDREDDEDDEETDWEEVDDEDDEDYDDGAWDDDEEDEDE